MKMLVGAYGGPEQGGTVPLHLRGPSLTGLGRGRGAARSGMFAQRSRALARRQESSTCPYSFFFLKAV